MFFGHSLRFSTIDGRSPLRRRTLLKIHKYPIEEFCVNDKTSKWQLRGDCVLRAIHIFPAFENIDSINMLRASYDPLANFIPPHITLVFPFESGEISSDGLTAHVQEATADLRPFSVALRGVTGAEGGYLFLNVKIGNDHIIQLHDRLYSGILRPYLYRHLTYVPHLTVGRIQDPGEFEAALEQTVDWNETFETTVHEFVVERIEDDGTSVEELSVPLLA